jgi:hypothetical protein
MSEVNQKVLNQIQQMLNRTTERGCTEHEAQEAANKVQELLLKHNIEMSQIPATSDKGKPDVGHVDIPMASKKVQVFEWCLRLAGAVSGACTCEYLWQRQNQSLTFVGGATDVKVATELYQFLAEQIQVLSVRRTWNIPDLLPGQPSKTLKAYGLEFPGPKSFQWPTTKGSIDPTFRRAFLIGCTARVAARLEEQTRETRGALDFSGQVTALMAVKDGLIRSYIAKQFRVGGPSRVTKRAQISAEGYRAGYEAGGSVDLSPRTKLGTGS